MDLASHRRPRIFDRAGGAAPAMPQEPRLFRRPLQAGVEANVEPGHRIETQENGVSVLKVTIGGREVGY